MEPVEANTSVSPTASVFAHIPIPGHDVVRIDVPQPSRPAPLGNLAEALAKAQAEFITVPKTKTATIKSERTGHTYTYTYADLADVLGMALPRLSKYGLAFSQPLRRANGKLYLVSELTHSSGETKSDDGIEISEVGADPRLFGIKLTYFRRYGASTFLGVVADEDLDVPDDTDPGAITDASVAGLRKPVVPSLSKKDESTAPAKASRPEPSQSVAKQAPAQVSVPPVTSTEPVPAKEVAPVEPPKVAPEPTPQEMAKVISAALKEKYPKSSETLRHVLAIMNAVPSIEDLTKTPEGKTRRDNSARFLYRKSVV